MAKNELTERDWWQGLMGMTKEEYQQKQWAKGKDALGVPPPRPLQYQELPVYTPQGFGGNRYPRQTEIPRKATSGPRVTQDLRPGDAGYVLPQIPQLTEKEKNKKIIDDWLRESKEQGPLSSDDLFRMNAEWQRKLRNPSPQSVKNAPYPAKSSVQAPLDVNLMTQAQRDKIIDDWMKADLSEISAPRQQEFHSPQPMVQMNKSVGADSPQVLMNEPQFNKGRSPQNLKTGAKQFPDNVEIQLERPRENYKIPENPYVINSQELQDLLDARPLPPWKKQSGLNFVDPLLRPYLQNKPTNDSMEETALDSDEKILFDELHMDATTVGQRKDEKTEAIAPYDIHSGTVPEDLQRDIYELCEEADVDYYLVMATLLHESGTDPNALDPVYGGAGYMQIMPDTWRDYKKESGYYYENKKWIRDLYEAAESMGADFNNKFDPLANIATGIAHYGVWNQDYTWGDDMSQVVNHYGEGGRHNKDVKDSRKIYPILAPSTYEILYYRDKLAAEKGEPTWYVGDLYDIEGNQLR